MIIRLRTKIEGYNKITRGRGEARQIFGLTLSICKMMGDPNMISSE